MQGWLALPLDRSTILFELISIKIIKDGDFATQKYFLVPSWLTADRTESKTKKEGWLTIRKSLWIPAQN